MNEKLIPKGLKKDYDDFKKSLFRGYNDHLDLSYRIFNKLFEVVEIIERNKDQVEKNLDSNYKKVIMLLFYDSFRIFWSILVLCEDGFATQGAILLRSLMEKVTDIAWLSKLDLPKREEKAKDFLDFGVVAAKQLFDKYNEHDIYSKVDEKTKQMLLNDKSTILQRYSEIENKYPKNDKGFIYRWTNESNRKKTGYVNEGALKDYDFYYWYLSFLSHSTVMGDVKYFQISEMSVHELLYLNIKYMSLAFNRWDLVFDLGLGEVKKEFVNSLNSLKNPVRKEQTF